MRLSKNVIYTKFDNGLILFNTISKELITVDNISNIDQIVNESSIGYLKEHNFITESLDRDICEYKLIKDGIKYNNDILSFVIHTNYSCNLRCQYCYQAQINSNETMNERVANNLIGFINELIELRKPNYLDLCFIGGEPLIEKKTIDIILKGIDTTNILNVSKSIVTNGTLLNDNYVEWIKTNNFNGVQITLDGAKNYHDTLRINYKGTGTYDIIYNNLIKYNKILPFILNINLNAENYQSINKLLSDLIQDDIKVKLVFSEIFDSKENKYEKKIPVDSNIWFETHKVAIGLGYKFDPFYRNNDFACDLYRKNSFIISPLGDLYKCLSGVGIDKYKIGSIYDYFTIETEIKESQYIESNKMELKCFECEYKVICGVNCHYKNTAFTCYKDDIVKNDVGLLVEQLKYDRSH
jgi:uncharacterized protein